MRKELMIASVILGGQSYLQRVLGLFGSSLIGYWPMDETSGTTATDKSPQANHGAYVGSISLAAANAPAFVGGVVPSFNGTNARNNVYSAAFDADFNGQEGAIRLLSKVSAASDWNTNGQFTFGFQVDASNRILMKTYNGTGSDYGFTVGYTGGGVNISFVAKKLSNFTDWLDIWYSWSKAAGQFHIYINGVLCDWEKYNGTSFPLSLTGTWVGALASGYANFGYLDTFWKGNLAQATMLNRPVTAAEVRALNPNGSILFDGDSRTAGKAYPFEAFGASSKTQYGFKHLGTGGAGLSTLTTNAPANVDIWKHGSSICVIWAGVNDSGQTAQQIHDAIKVYCQARQAAGWRVLVCTEIDAQDASRVSNGWSAKYLTLNTLLRADYADFANGIADLGANANLQDATNITYFDADKVHLTAAGYTVVAGIVGAALTSM